MRIKGNVSKFVLHHLDCKIDSPRFSELGPQSANSFVVLLEDLVAFTQHWFYTDVTNPGQNEHLRLTLDIKDPYAAAHDDGVLPKRLQRQLLDPFGRIKGLDSFIVNGPHFPSIEKDVRAEQAVPNKTPRACLEEATRLKDAGNLAFKEQKWDDALQLYLDAFNAIYIVCKGRKRSIWGDGSFQVIISGGKHDGEFAQQVRIILRITLVANVVAVYLKKEEFEEARYWGLRSINLMRQSMGEYIN